MKRKLKNASRHAYIVERDILENIPVNIGKKFANRVSKSDRKFIAIKGRNREYS